MQNRIPTKVYECLALKRPMLIQKNLAWEQYLGTFPFRSAFFIDYDDPEAARQIYPHLRNQRFYHRAGQIEGIHWEEEEDKLIGLFEKLMKV
ncbi:MAG: hypothetical protein HC880_17815 [Bacteroidia bacterium]|nr:hypothetical protein [Bacteroidia bacterium]